MKRIIISGSPRANGRSAHIAEMLFEAHIDERPGDELFLVPVSEIEIGPCIGCNACRRLTDVILKADDGAEYTEPRPRCVFDDDMQSLYDLLDDADELTIVSPVYFSGAPGMMKCLLDRLQPYFWANIGTLGNAESDKGNDGERGNAREQEPVKPWRPRQRRPATLHVVGEGGDPHGFDPLVSEVKSAIACADFRLERVYDWVGKVTPEGEITAEAREIEIAKPLVAGARAGEQTNDQAGARVGDQPQPQPKPKPRPKLDLSSPQATGKSKAKPKGKKRG